MAVEDVNRSYPPATWTVGGQTLAFVPESIAESGANRIVEHERPYRDGALLADTGSKAIRWTFETIWNNSIEQPGLEVNEGLALYPDVLNLMIESFDRHEVGDLVVPTVGKQRARAESYQRTEVEELRDTARVRFTFVADNEDRVDARSITAPTANADAQRLAEQTTFDQQSINNWDQSLADLETAVNDLEDLANAPFDQAALLERTAERVIDLVKSVRQRFGRVGVRGRDTLLGPRGNKSQRALHEQQDLAARSVEDARRSRPRTVSLVLGVDSSLFQVAAYLQQSLIDLLLANPQVADPTYLPRGSVVRVLQGEGRYDQVVGRSRKRAATT